MNISILSINPITHIPSLRYIVDYFIHQKKATVSITEIYIKNLNSYYNNIPGLIKKDIIIYENYENYKTGLSKITLKKYLKILSTLFHIYQSKQKEIIYTNDFQVVYLNNFINKFFFKKKVSLIYHQFELIEKKRQSKISSYIYQSVCKNANKIDLCVFPEINRLNYFLNSSSANKKSVLLFPNTCKPNNSIIEPTPIIDFIPDDSFIVLHVGTVGGKQHYFINFLKAIEKLKNEKDITFIFLGRMDKEVEQLSKTLKLENIHFFDSIPHEQLYGIYKRTNLGVILYKGTSLNYEYCAPNKLYEFWSQGIPVIGHNLKSLTPIFVKYFMGTLTNFENENLIIDSILKLKEDKKLNKEILKNYFEKHLSISNYIKMFDEKIKEF
jgi:hypothetical protein